MKIVVIGLRPQCSFCSCPVFRGGDGESLTPFSQKRAYKTIIVFFFVVLPGKRQE